MESHDTFYFFLAVSEVTFPEKPWLCSSGTVTLEGLTSVIKSETQRWCCRHCWWNRRGICSICILVTASFFSFSWSLPQLHTGRSEHQEEPWGFRRWKSTLKSLRETTEQKQGPFVTINIEYSCGFVCCLCRSREVLSFSSLASLPSLLLWR